MNNCMNLSKFLLYASLRTHLSTVVALFKNRLDKFSESPSNVEKDWLSTATSHPAPFYSILYCGATIYAKEVRRLHNQRCALAACLGYKLAAFDAINDHLDDSTTAATDEMVLAVLILMNFDNVKIHHMKMTAILDMGC
jgi:hypothetical protein